MCREQVPLLHAGAALSPNHVAACHLQDRLPPAAVLHERNTGGERLRRLQAYFGAPAPQPETTGVQRMIRKTAFAASRRALAVGAAAQAQTLRIGLREDPDILDPTLARTFVGRIVFAALCDKLFDINEKLEIVPQLATGYHWEDPKTLLITLRDGRELPRRRARWTPRPCAIR